MFSFLSVPIPVGRRRMLNLKLASFFIYKPNPTTMKKILLSLLFVIFYSFLIPSAQAQPQTFKEYAKEFIATQTNVYETFHIACTGKLITTDEQGNTVKVSPKNAFKYLKYFFEFKKYKIKSKSKTIEFSDGEFTVSLYFRVSDLGIWELYKYDSIL